LRHAPKASPITTCWSLDSDTGDSSNPIFSVCVYKRASSTTGLPYCALIQSFTFTAIHHMDCVMDIAIFLVTAPLLRKMLFFL